MGPGAADPGKATAVLVAPIAPDVPANKIE